MKISEIGRMQIKREMVEEKIIKIRKLIDRIENMDFSEEKFDEDVDIQDLLVFRLEQAVEQAIDVATHLVSAKGVSRPGGLADLFAVLGKERVLSEEVSGAMVKAVGFRNIAVHEYEEEKFDVKRVYGDYKDDLRDLKRFCAEVVGILEKDGGGSG